MDLKSSYIQDAYQALETELISLLIKRLTAKTLTELTKDSVFQWQLEKMQELRMMNFATIDKLVDETAKFTKEELKELITEQGYDINKEANKQMANLMKTPIKRWTGLDLVLNQYFESQWLDLDNHVNQTLITRNFAQNKLYQAYQQVLNDTVAKVLTGFKTPQEALKSAIYDLSTQGLKSGLVDASGREWSLERYVRTVIKSTTQHVYNDLRVERGKEYGIVTAYMSSKLAAREACATIQGKYVLTVPKSQAPQEFQHLESIYDHGYGTPAGCFGINCGHRMYAMLPDDLASVKPPVPPKEAIANAKIVAKQRRLEVAIRQAKKQAHTATLLNDQEDIAKFNNLIRNRQASLRQLIKDNKELLHRDYSREAIYTS